jgi:hypothetical protein
VANNNHDIQELSDHLDELLEKQRKLETDYRSDRRWVITAAGMLSVFVLAFFGITVTQIPEMALAAIDTRVQEDVAKQLPPVVSSYVITETVKQVPTEVAKQIPDLIAAEVNNQIPAAVENAVGQEAVDRVQSTTGQIMQNAEIAQQKLDSIKALEAAAMERSERSFVDNAPAGFAFLSNQACPAGFGSVEDGYIKLGGQGLSLTATGSNSRELNHNHQAGNLVAAIGFGGKSPNLSIANRRVGETFTANRILALDGGMDTTNINGSASAIEGATGDATLSFNVEPRHIVLRLCIIQ